jgi:1-phosphatidylinositol-4-phosphate 5-kinase
MYGIYKWANGDIYEGYWLNNKREGYGVLKKVDELTYEGEWVNN